MQCQIEDESNLLYCYQVRNCPFSCHYSQLQHTCKCIKGNLEEETRKTMKMRLGRKTLLKNSQVEEGGSTLHLHVIFMLCFISKPCQISWTSFSFFRILFRVCVCDSCALCSKVKEARCKVLGAVLVAAECWCYYCKTFLKCCKAILAMALVYPQGQFVDNVKA